MANTKLPASDFNSQSISDLNVLIETPDGTKHDVTLAVASISITESINTFHYFGKMTLMDSAGLREDLPIVGQEKVIVTFLKEGVDYETTLCITAIDQADKSSNIAQLVLYLSNPNELINTTKIFSRSYTGLGSNILNKIHAEFFATDLDDVDTTQNSINYIVPFATPYEAMTAILDKSHDINFYPMYLYQTLYENKVKLKSLSSLLNQDAVYTFKDSPVTTGPNKDPGYRGLIDDSNINRILNFNVKAFDIQTNMKHGVYGSFTTNYDITSKMYNVYRYKYETDKTQDYLNDDFKVGSRALADIHTTRHFLHRKNQLGFESLSNLNSHATEALPRRTSLYNDQFSIVIEAQLNSRPGIYAGCILNIDLDKDKPKVTGGDYEDEQLSGNYLVHTLTHNISNERYSLYTTLVKDRIR